MKFYKILFVVAALESASFAFAEEAKKDTAAVQAGEEKKEPVSKPAGCCAKKEAAGEKCTHECCAEAAKAGNNCEKCKGSGKIEKKEEAKK